MLSLLSQWASAQAGSCLAEKGPAWPHDPQESLLSWSSSVPGVASPVGALGYKTGTGRQAFVHALGKRSPLLMRDNLPLKQLCVVPLQCVEAAFSCRWVKSLL